MAAEAFAIQAGVPHSFCILAELLGVPMMELEWCCGALLVPLVTGKPPPLLQSDPEMGFSTRRSSRSDIFVFRSWMVERCCRMAAISVLDRRDALDPDGAPE